MKHLMMRSRVLKLNDPRCYDGCLFDAEYVWGDWEILSTFKEGVSQEEIDKRLLSWRNLNTFAVAGRGEKARCEFDILDWEE